jgi:hypothetical protein
MAEKKKVIRITTPAGVALYPKVQKPDTKFKSEGLYSTSLIIATPKCEELCAQLDAFAEEAHADALADPKKVSAAKAKRKTITKNEPYLPELDKEGNETGNIIFKFKMNASAEINGEVKHFKPTLYDASNPPKEITRDINMYSGSTIKVNFTPSLYYNDANAQAGVSCRLNGVQVLKLVKGGWTAESFGFAAEEEGFDFADGTPAGPDTPAPGAEGGEGKAASDF